MGEVNWNKVETIIDEVLNLPEEKRYAYIEETCGHDQKLKSEVTQLIESIFDSEGWLKELNDDKYKFYNDVSEDLEFLSTHQDFIGQQVGSYTIKKKIGQGGMGQVYLAERTDGNFEHQVAIKIIRQNQATKTNIERFRREQRILASLKHSGIAQLYDGGVTAESFPYIIMEYVDGIPINEYCQKHECSIDDQIALFKQVLKAVRYAHENLVIHRDLKPDNILVDANGKVKILDFGISKLLHNEEDLSLTQTGARILTPKYAAPEQIKQTNITTATDLYSLGIIFYELLAEAPPFNLSDCTAYEAEQIILTKHPDKPSSKASSQQKAQSIRGDLNAIALKAIRKEPQRRYRVATEFLEDLNHYLDGLPVSARNNSFQYRASKFIARHKKSLAASAIALILIVGLSGYYTLRIAEERDHAKVEALKAQNTKEILVNIFKANDPISGDAETATLPKLLENGTKNVLQRNLDPEVKIELLFTLSTIYQNISNFDKARQLVDTTLKFSNRHFGSNAVTTARGHIKLGGIAYDLGNYEEGKEELITSKKILADKNPSNPVYATLYHHLGFVEEGMSNYDSAKVYFQKALNNVNQQTRVDTALYIDIIKSLGRTTHREGDYKTADSLMFKALKTSEHFNGKNDAVTASIAGDIGLYYMTRAKYDSSRIYYQQSLDIKNKLYNKDPHPNHSATLTNLGVLESYVGNNAVAESLFTQALTIDTKLYGNDHPYVAFSKGHLASIYFEKKQYEKAKQLREEQLTIYQNNYEPDHYNMAGFYHKYGNLFSATSEYQKAQSYYKESENIYLNYISENDDTFAKLYEDWAINDFKMKRYQEAIEKFRKAADTFIPSKYDEYKVRGAKCLINAAKSHAALDQINQAEDILEKLKSHMDTTTVLAQNEDIQTLYNQVYNEL